jgi:hypothetical protein
MDGIFSSKEFRHPSRAIGSFMKLSLTGGITATNAWQAGLRSCSRDLRFLPGGGLGLMMLPFAIP